MNEHAEVNRRVKGKDGDRERAIAMKRGDRPPRGNSRSPLRPSESPARKKKRKMRGAEQTPFPKGEGDSP